MYVVRASNIYILASKISKITKSFMKLNLWLNLYPALVIKLTTILDQDLSFQPCFQ